MTFQKSQTICHLEWENVAGCSQSYLEIFFVSMLLTEPGHLNLIPLRRKQ